jgi:hypothetical protein
MMNLDLPIFISPELAGLRKGYRPCDRQIFFRTPASRITVNVNKDDDRFVTSANPVPG